MPMIDFTLPAGSFTPAVLDKLVSEMTSTLLGWEQVPVNDKGLGIAWVIVNEVPTGHLYVAGERAQKPYYRVMLRVPQGQLDDEHYAGVVRDVTKLIFDAEGGDHTEEDGIRVFVTLQEILDGNWGIGGNVAWIDDINRYVEADEDRIEWGRKNLLTRQGR